MNNTEVAIKEGSKSYMEIAREYDWFADRMIKKQQYSSALGWVQLAIMYSIDGVKNRYCE